MPKIRSALVVAAASAALLLTGACTKDGKAKATAPQAMPAVSAPAPNAVVATIGDAPITAAELDEQIAGELDELEREKFRMRKKALEDLILKRLVAEEAKKKGMTEEQWLKAEIADKVTPVSDEEAKKFFDQNAHRMPPGAGFEAMKGDIAQLLGRQQRARQVFDQLKKDAKVKVLLSEPRKEVAATGPSRGPEDAKVTIVTFSDFQCPFCSRARDTVEQVMTAYAGKVRLVFRHFPLDFHDKAQKAAEASLCAHEQGQFWGYHDLLFKNQQKLDLPELKQHAASLGLDAGKFDACLDSGKYAKAVADDMAAGKKAGVNGTPAFFINGQVLSGAQPFEEFKRVIDEELGS